MTVVTLVVLIEEHGGSRSRCGPTAWILIAVYGGYLLLRGLARWRASVDSKREGFTSVQPTSNPWAWPLADVQDTPGRYPLRYRTLQLGQGKSQGERSVEVSELPPSPGPVDSVQAALDRTTSPPSRRIVGSSRAITSGKRCNTGSCLPSVLVRCGHGRHGAGDRRSRRYRPRHRRDAIEVRSSSRLPPSKHSRLLPVALGGLMPRSDRGGGWPRRGRGRAGWRPCPSGEGSQPGDKCPAPPSAGESAAHTVIHRGSLRPRVPVVGEAP